MANQRIKVGLTVAARIDESLDALALALGTTRSVVVEDAVERRAASLSAGEQAAYDGFLAALHVRAKG